MAPYELPFEPVALPGHAIRLATLPDEVYEVIAIEQMARIGPVDYGSISSNDTATESGSNQIDLEDELEMDSDALGQFVINPLSRVEVEVRQTEAQEQRFVNSNKVGRITPFTPINQREVYIHEQGAPHVVIHNENEYDLDKSLIYYTGFQFILGDQLSESEIDRMPGEPATVPTDTLKQNIGGGRV